MNDIPPDTIEQECHISYIGHNEMTIELEGIREDYRDRFYP